MIAVLAVIAVILGVLYFTGVLGGDDEGSNAAEDKSASEQQDNSSNGANQGGGDTTDQDNQEQDTQDTQEQDTGEQGDGGDTGGQGGAGTPEDAFKQYMQAVQESDCETLKSVVKVPDMAEGQEDQFFEGMCETPESQIDMDPSNIEMERVKDGSQEVTLGIKAGGSTVYEITCVQDGAWKVDPMSIEFE